MGEEGRKEDKHCPQLSRVQFRQSSCLAVLCRRVRAGAALCLQHLFLNATRRYQGSTDRDSLTSSSHVGRSGTCETKGDDETLTRSALSEMQ